MDEGWDGAVRAGHRRQLAASGQRSPEVVVHVRRCNRQSLPPARLAAARAGLAPSRASPPRACASLQHPTAACILLRPASCCGQHPTVRVAVLRSAARGEEDSARRAELGAADTPMRRALVRGVRCAHGLCAGHLFSESQLDFPQIVSPCPQSGRG